MCMRYFLIIFIILFSSELRSNQKKNLKESYIILSDEDNKKIKKLKNNTNQEYIGKPLVSNNKKKENEKSKFSPLVTKGKLRSTSIGSIGVHTKLNDKFGLSLWDSFSSSDAIKNLNYLPNIVSSNFLQDYLVDLYASISAPPSGNA